MISAGRLKEFIRDEKEGVKAYGKAAKEDPAFRALQSDEKKHARVLKKKFNYAKKQRAA